MWVETYQKGKENNVQTVYRFVERYIDPKTGKSRKVSVSYEKNTRQTRKSATIELQEKIKKKIAELKATNSNITIRKLADKFLEAYKQRVALRTYIINDAMLKSFCNYIGNDTLARLITTTMINRYFQQRLYDKDNHISNSTARNTRKALSMTYKFATEYGYLTNNPVTDVHINYRNDVSTRRDRIENKYLTTEEYRKILDYCDCRHKPYYRDAFEFQYLTGLRFGELIALQVHDIKKKNSKMYIEVNGTMVTALNSEQIKEDRTKTIAGMREILLSSKAKNIVERNVKNKKKEDFIFTRPATAKTPERTLRLNSANVFLKSACREQGIKKDVTTHFFRHTHVSVLADLGVPLRVIQKRVGHADSDITRRIYLHVTKKAENEFADMIDNIDDTE